MKSCWANLLSVMVILSLILFGCLYFPCCHALSKIGDTGTYRNSRPTNRKSKASEVSNIPAPESNIRLRFCILRACGNDDCYCCLNLRPIVCYTTLPACQLVCPPCSPVCRPGHRHSLAPTSTMEGRP
ncbi:hypothetical protein BDA96_08G199800 [Sorghum bicolor]|uniref:Uncharacterized protein n=1 Tax=Sorghum bicolor TaxID=4558 RepID=A0A921QJY5_SORBI|nr:hypothetical protein BDA96_08G199800 [Sorghum bicolor]